MRLCFNYHFRQSVALSVKPNTGYRRKILNKEGCLLLRRLLRHRELYHWSRECGKFCTEFRKVINSLFVRKSFIYQKYSSCFKSLFFKSTKFGKRGRNDPSNTFRRYCSKVPKVEKYKGTYSPTNERIRSNIPFLYQELLILYQSKRTRCPKI